MKKIILFLILCSWSGYQCQAVEENGRTNDQPVVATFVVPANKAYAEPFVTGNPGVSVPVGWVESRGAVSLERPQTQCGVVRVSETRDL